MTSTDSQLKIKEIADKHGLTVTEVTNIIKDQFRVVHEVISEHVDLDNRKEVYMPKLGRIVLHNAGIKRLHKRYSKDG